MPSKQDDTIRKQLARKLKDDLDLLTSKYFLADIPKNSFPLADELYQIRTTANVLGIALGRKVGPFPQTWQLFKYLENRYPNLTLTDFCYKLLSKMETVPLGPLTRISHIIAKQQNDNSSEALRLKKILQLLDQDSMPSIGALAWSD